MDSVKQKTFHRRVELLELITVSSFHYCFVKPAQLIPPILIPHTQWMPQETPALRIVHTMYLHFIHTFLTHTIKKSHFCEGV